MQRLFTLFFLPLKSIQHDWVCVLRQNSTTSALSPLTELQHDDLKKKKIQAISLREHTFFILAQITSKRLLLKLRIRVILHAIILVLKRSYSKPLFPIPLGRSLSTFNFTFTNHRTSAPFVCLTPPLPREARIESQVGVGENFVHSWFQSK